MLRSTYSDCLIDGFKSSRLRDGELRAAAQKLLATNRGNFRAHLQESCVAETGLINSVESQVELQINSALGISSRLPGRVFEFDVGPSSPKDGNSTCHFEANAPQSAAQGKLAPPANRLQAGPPSVGGPASAAERPEAGFPNVIDCRHFPRRYATVAKLR